MAYRLTKREAALAMMSQSPLDAEIVVPEPRAKRTNPEADFQQSCVKHYRERCALDRTLRDKTRLYAVNPLSQKLNGWQQDFCKRMGIVKGVYDLHFMDKRHGFQYTWIECKSLKGTLTDEQEKWWEWLDGTPILRTAIRTLDDFIAVIGG